MAYDILYLVIIVINKKKEATSLNLSTLKIGETAVILEFNGISDSFSRRLYDVGISIGSEVTMLNVLNFGQLFYISIEDVDFCIRVEDAKKIKIQKI